MPKGQKQMLKLPKENIQGNKCITRQRIQYSMGKFFYKVCKRQYICSITEWDCPDLVSKEKFKREYLDPLKRAADQYLSAVVYWRELDINLVTPAEYAEVQDLWLRVDQYIRKQ